MNGRGYLLLKSLNRNVKMPFSTMTMRSFLTKYTDQRVNAF